MRRLLIMAVLTQLALAGCVVKVRTVNVAQHAVPLAPATISSPVKAHLRDGSIIVFQNGVTVTPTAIIGDGTRYDLTLNVQGSLSRSVPLDSVMAFESYRAGVNEAASVAATLLATSAGVLGTGVALVALFGSCPTIYADSAGTAWMQAESFSYSIVPLFETRDVDAVYGRADAAGVVWLELRNEALETHYINHIELLEVRHAATERLLPDELGRPVLAGVTIAPHRAEDALKRSVLGVLAARDSSWYETADERITLRRAANFTDHIDLAFTLAEDRDSVALVLNLRNSLLNTILFYDIMLGGAGAHALDWLGSTLEEIGEATQVGRWYNEHSGVRVSVWQDGAYEQVARVGDAGPIAWKSVAVMLPARGSRNVRVRLEFLADSWRIDHAALAPDARRGAERVVPVSHLRHARAEHDTAALARMLEPDDQYFITYPGTSVRLGFDVRPAPTHSDSVVSYLFAAQGYYTEWVRADWVKNATTPVQFLPGDDALERAFQRWLTVRSDFEAEFFARRVPVRQP